MTSEQKLIFKTKRTASRSYEWEDNVQMEVKYEFNFDTRQVHRDIYGVTDVLKDVGGLSTSLITGFSVLVMLLNWNKDMVEYGIMLMGLKEIRKRCIEDGEIDPKDKGEPKHKKPLFITPWKIIKLNLLNMSKRKKGCCCFKRTQEYILLKKAMELFKEKCDTIELLWTARDSKEVNKLSVE